MKVWSGRKALAEELNGEIDEVHEVQEGVEQWRCMRTVPVERFK